MQTEKQLLIPAEISFTKTKILSPSHSLAEKALVLQASHYQGLTEAEGSLTCMCSLHVVCVHVLICTHTTTINESKN